MEEFVLTNPDLQEEFVMFQQSVLKADDISFNKETLFRKEQGPGDIEEKLLLRLDNELSLSENAALTAFMHSDDALQQQWDILQQTKLAADTSIVFKDKQSLYRKENGRVVPFPWMKLAAAAVFLGFIIWGGVAYLGDNGDGANELVQQDKLPKVTKPVENVQPAPARDSVPTTIAAEDVAVNEDMPVPSTERVVNAPKPGPKKVEKAVMAVQKETLATIKTNNLPEPHLDNLNKTNSNKNIATIVKPPKNATNMSDAGNHVSAENLEESTDVVNTFATAASLAESNEELNDNRILFMDEDKVKKTKIGGLFRKVKRVFERNANVKEGNNKIKVANLEFAIQ